LRPRWTLHRIGRTIKDPTSVLPNYQALLETDADIRPALKNAWNSILASEYKKGE
jgi:hypothetical protein